MLMPIGKFKGQPVDTMTTQYLCWLVCNDAIRFKRWQLVRAALVVLRERFKDFDTLENALSMTTQPPEYWKAEKAKREASLAAERAEKLRQLEARRAEERQRKRDERKRKYQEMKEQVAAEEAARLNNLRDGYYARRSFANVEDLL